METTVTSQNDIHGEIGKSRLNSVYGTQTRIFRVSFT